MKENVKNLREQIESMQLDMKIMKEDLLKLKVIQTEDAQMLYEVVAWYLGVHNGLTELKRKWYPEKIAESESQTTPQKPTPPAPAALTKGGGNTTRPSLARACKRQKTK